METTEKKEVKTPEQIAAEKLAAAITDVEKLSGKVVILMAPEAEKMYQQLRDYKYRNIPERMRVSVRSFIEQLTSFDNAKAAQKYAETQATNALEKLVTTVAKQRNITIQEAAKALGVTLPE
jgi:hypothetical protein